MSDAPIVLSKQDVAPVKASKSVTFTPTTFDEAVTFAKMIANSDVVPREYKGKHGNILVAMQMGAELGLAPMQALQSIAVINGKPSVYGDSALAIVQATPSYEWHKESISGEGDARTALCIVKRKGQDPTEVKFSVADAKKANLWGKEGPWKQYPDRMLQMRARGFALRDKFADALRGMAIAEEVSDYNTNVRPKDIERGSLTTAQQLSTMSQSKEPNRGHGNEGTERKQPEKTMCAECRQIDGHADDCKQNPKNKTKKGDKEKVDKRDAWAKQPGHDPKKHIDFDDARQLFETQRNLKLSEEEMHAFLEKEFKIQHRYHIPKDKFQDVLGALARQYGQNSAAEENLDAEPEESESAEDTGERNTAMDGLFEQGHRSQKDPG